MGILEAIVFGNCSGVDGGFAGVQQRAFGAVSKYFQFPGGYDIFDTMLHVGTLVAVLVVFWQDVVSILKKPVQKLTGLILVANRARGSRQRYSLRISLKVLLKANIWDMDLIVTAILLVAAEWVVKRYQKRRNNVKYRDAVVMGLHAGRGDHAGYLPGGFHAGGRSVFGHRPQSGRALFLPLSIPVILGSLVLQGYHLIKTGVGADRSSAHDCMLFAAVSGFRNPFYAQPHP